MGAIVALLVGWFGPLWGKLIPWLIGAVVVAGLAFGVWAHFRHVASLEQQVGTLTQELGTAVAANAKQKQDYETSLAQDKAAYDQALKERDAASADAAKLKDILNALNSSPPGRDAPIAPVLNDAITSLYGP